MRLSANFVNLEVTVTGVPKLRIPTTLLREKQRTAKRFSVTKPQSKPQTNSHQYLKICLKTDPVHTTRWYVYLWNYINYIFTTKRRQCLNIVVCAGDAQETGYIVCSYKHPCCKENHLKTASTQHRQCA